MRYFAKPSGRLVTGIVLVIVGLLDLVARATADWVGFGVAALGAAYGLTAFVDRRANRVA